MHNKLCVVFLVKAQIRYGHVFPQKQAVPYGNSAQISCYSATFVTWKMDFIQRAFTKQLGNTLYISNVNAKNYGFYECHGTYPNGSVFVKDAGLLVGSELLSYRLL